MVTYAAHITNVQAVADEMANISQTIQQTLANLEAEAATTLAEWSGGSQQAYYAAKQNWDSAASDMAFQAGRAAACLGSISDAYALAEYNGLGLWGG